jgi:rhamnulokinase
MTLEELDNVDAFRQVVTANYDLTTFIPQPDSEIARHIAQFHTKPQRKELCA